MLSVQDIRKKALALGVEGIEAMGKTELIRAIQIKEGHTPCFGTDWCKPEWRQHCAWKDECKAEDYYAG